MIALPNERQPILDRFRDRQPVIVRMRRGNQPPTYVRGIILERRPKAAKVKTDKWTNYVWWADIEAAPEEPKAPEKPLATIADAVATQERPPAVIMPIAEVEKHQKWAEEAKAKEETMTKRGAPKTMSDWRSKTQIGALVRERRLERGEGQREFAHRLGLPDQSALSRIERGEGIPGDDCLIKLAELDRDLDIGELIQMRDHDAQAYPRAAKALGIKVIELPVKTKALARRKPLEQTGIKPHRAEPSSGTFEFIEDLCGVAPIPSDPSKRKEWMALARKLRALLD